MTPFLRLLKWYSIARLVLAYMVKNCRLIMHLFVRYHIVALYAAVLVCWFSLNKYFITAERFLC